MFLVWNLSKKNFTLILYGYYEHILLLTKKTKTNGGNAILYNPFVYNQQI